MRTPVQFSKLLTCAGVFILSLLQVNAQSGKGQRQLLEFQAGGFIPTQPFTPELAAISNTINPAIDLTSILGGTPPSFTHLAFGSGSGATFGLSYLGDLNAPITLKAGFNYTARTLNIYTDFVKTGNIKLNSPALQLNLVYNPFRKTNQHLLIMAGVEVGLNQFSDFIFYNQTDTLADIPFIGSVEQTTKVTFRAADKLQINACMGLSWINHIWKKLYMSVSAGYFLPLQNEYEFSTDLTVNNPLFPASATTDSPAFSIANTRVSAGILLRLGKAD